MTEDVLPDKDINDLIDFSYKERGRVVTMSEMKAERDSSVLPAELMKHAQTSIGIYDIVDKIINFEDVTDDANKFRKDLWLPVSAVTKEMINKKQVISLIEEAYAKYSVKRKEIGTMMHLDSDIICTMVNHPISAMRAELLEVLGVKP